MARARNIKPAFFDNEYLASLPALARLLFIGLWTIADFNGCLEHRPARIKKQILPYDDCDIDELIASLVMSRERNGAPRFIISYSVDGYDYLKIVNFNKHQNPHPHERQSGSNIPNFDESSHQLIDNKGVITSNDLDVTSNCEAGTRNADSLLPITDSLTLIPASLIPHTDPLDCKITNLKKPKKKRLQVASDTADQELCREIWSHYKNAYFNRYGTDPVRNAKVNKQVRDLLARLGQEAKFVAEYYVYINDAYLIKRSHDFGSLLAGAESYRTQWATGKQVTTTTANQMDRTNANALAVAAAAEIIKAKHAARGIINDQ